MPARNELQDGVLRLGQNPVDLSETAGGIDRLSGERHNALFGSPLQVIADLPPPSLGEAHGIVVFVDGAGELPSVPPDACDVLVTTYPDPPPPWVATTPERLPSQLAAIRRTVDAAPVACSITARILRLSENMPVDDALDLESLAYSTLLGGSEFAHWLARRARVDGLTQTDQLVHYQREGDRVTLSLASPINRNAMTAPMRDALYEALVNVAEDPSAPAVLLTALGPCFSTGGALQEFGTATDLARAHLIRTLRSSTRLLFALGERATARLHGACIGSGIEIPAAAAHRIGTADLIVQLPELRMGLIPGAGGSVSLARAVGRHRLLWMLLGAFRIGAFRALDWGLIKEIVR